MSIIKSVSGLLLFTAIILFGLFTNNHFARNIYLVDLDEDKLSENELKMVKDVHLLLKNADLFWKGIENIEIPIILYNDKYEFLITDKLPDSNWMLIDSISLKPRYI